MSPFVFSFSLYLLFTLRFAGLSPYFFFLYLSLSLYSKFGDMTINLSLILKKKKNTDAETFSAFRSRLY